MALRVSRSVQRAVTSCRPVNCGAIAPTLINDSTSFHLIDRQAPHSRTFTGAPLPHAPHAGLRSPTETAGSVIRGSQESSVNRDSVINRQVSSPNGSRWLVAAGMSFAAAAAFGSMTAAAKEATEKKVPADVVLYQYDSCPFCNKVKGRFFLGICNHGQLEVSCMT